MTARAPSKHMLTGRHIAIAMICFFGVVIGVNLTLAIFANSSWTGLIVKNSYVASQKFNSELESAERQRQRGWQADFEYRGKRFDLRLKNREGRELAGLAVALELGRAPHENDDLTRRLTERAAGLYSADIDLAAGLWVGVVTIRQAGSDPYRQNIRLTVPGKERL